MDEPNYIAFYWIGGLPQISILAIVSALNKTEKTQVLVFLDSDSGMKNSVPTSFDWLRSHPRLNFIDFSLTDWVISATPKPQWLISSRIRRVVVACLNSAKPIRGLGKILPKCVTKQIGFWHPIFGWKARTAPAYAIRYEGAQFRGDTFRVLLADKFPNESILYVDADVYIARALNQWDLKSSFSYRGGDSWANTAILFYHAKRDKAISHLMSSYQVGHSPLPWFMFTDSFCLMSDIEIRPTDEYDPGWSASSVSHADSSLFFRNTESTDQFLSEIRNDLLAIHWHNQWAVDPDKGSPYQVLLVEETLKLEAEMQKFRRSENFL